MRIAVRWRRSALRKAWCMRSPRSRPRCSRSATGSVRKSPWCCVACNSTGPQWASTAVCTAWRMRRICSRAAPAAPRRGARRVFTRPASGARAKTMTMLSALIGVLAREALRGNAERIEQPQAPHEDDGAQHAARLPAPPRGRDALAQAGRAAAALHGAAEGDVLHQRDLREAGKRVAPHEDRLIAGGNAREARAQVHGTADDLEQRMAAFDLHIEAPPARLVERAQDVLVGALRQARISVQENERFGLCRVRTGIQLHCPALRW